MKKMLEISVCLLLCLLSVPASGAGRSARAAETGSSMAVGNNFIYSSWAGRSRRGRSAPAEKCTDKKRHERTKLLPNTYPGQLRYLNMAGTATLTIREDQTFEFVMADESKTTISGELYAVTNCGETTAVMKVYDRRRGGPTSIRNISARVCRRGNDISISSLGGQFSFKTEGSARGGIPFEWGRCKN